MSKLLKLALHRQLSDPLPEREGRSMAKSIASGADVLNTFCLGSLERLSEHFPEPPPQFVHLIVQVPPPPPEPDAYKTVIDEINSIFQEHNIRQNGSDIITVHVNSLKTWTAGDIRIPQNRIRMLWDSSGQTPNETMDGARSKLDEMRIISDVCMFSGLP